MQIGDPDPAAVEAFWAAYCGATGHQGQPRDVFAFGDSRELADELLACIESGTKRATAGAAADHEAEGWWPEPGDLSVVCRGDGTPALVIRTATVSRGPMRSVTEQFAWDEGEGDRSRASWLADHDQFFARTFAATGRPYDGNPEVVFERFEVVWPSVLG